MKIKHIKIYICEACLDGIGSECHTPGCALFLHAVDIPIMPELYEVIAEYDEHEALNEKRDSQHHASVHPYHDGKEEEI